MNISSRFVYSLAISSLAIASTISLHAGDYKVVKTTEVPGKGSIDYVYADNEGGKLYVPRGSEVLAFDLNSLKVVGSITNARARGVAVDPKSHHGFCSSSPVVMWDTTTLAPIKTIAVEGGPDAIAYEPLTERIYVFSHRAPNATVIDAKEGTIVGTIDLGGAPEQAVSDGEGNLYVNLEDKDKVAVIDVKSMKVTKTFDLEGKGGGPAGLALDAKNHVLFAMCADPANCVVLDAKDGKILATLPLGKGNDSAAFNPTTGEAFSSQRDGTLTVIKEKSPTEFVVSETVTTKQGAKTCTLDAKGNQVVLITLNRTAGTGAPTKKGDRMSDPSPLEILVVGRQP